MSKPMIDGKKHVSEKPKRASVSVAFTPRNQLDLSPELKAEITEKGLEYRWVDAKQMAENGNLHKNHWEVYRRTAANVSQGEQSFGLPPDGTIRRGTVVLAVRPKETGDAHRQFLRDKADRQTLTSKKEGAEIRRISRQVFEDSEE